MVNIYTVLASGVAYSKLNTEVLKKKKKKIVKRALACVFTILVNFYLVMQPGVIQALDRTYHYSNPNLERVR